MTGQRQPSLIYTPQSTRSLRPRTSKPTPVIPTPTPRKRSTRKRRPKLNGDDGWFNINKVLDERQRGGRLEYLVDWEGDDPNTGEPYSPTWEEEIKEDARLEWEAEKQRRSKLAGNKQASFLSDADYEDRDTSSSKTSYQQSLETDVAEDESEDDDQPLGPGTWRNINRVISARRVHSRSAALDEATETRPCKRTKVALSRTPSVERTPSIISTGSPFSEPESLVLLESQDLDRLKRQNITIEISKDAAIDRSEYHSVGNTQGSSQLVSELEDEDSRIALTSEFSQGTIPDSQDPSAEHWSHPEQELVTAYEPQQSNPGPEESSQVPPESLVIPDSQDLSLSTRISGNTTSQGFGSLPLEQVTPDQSQQDVVPDSVAPEVDIPSRQLDRLQEPFLQGNESHSSITAAQLNTSDQQVREAVSSSCYQPPCSVAGSAEPVFLTQPQLSLESASPLNSSVSRVVQSSRDIDVVEAVPSSQAPGQNHEADIEAGSDLSRGQGTTVSASPVVTVSEGSESQAAQVVRRDFEIFPQEIRDSHESRVSTPSCESASKTTQEASHRTFLPPTQNSNPRAGSLQAPVYWDQIAPEGETDAYKQLRESSNRLAEILSSPSRPQTKRAIEPSSMDDKPPRQSAVDELRELLDFSPIEFTLSTHIGLDPPADAQPRAATEVSSEQQAVAPSTSESSAVPDITLQQPDLEVQSQALLQTAAWSPRAVVTDQGHPPQSISPASIMPNPERPANDETQGSPSPFDHSVASNLVSQNLDGQQATVSPADIVNSAETGDTSHTLLANIDHPIVSARIDDSSGQSITMGQVVVEDVSVGSPPTRALEATPPEHLITLPFQTSRRDPYDNILCEYQAESTEFGHVFSNEILTEPDESLVRKIDELFGRLFNICDYPQDLIGTDLEKLPAEDQAKYSCDANPKFNFMYELFKAVSKEIRILVVARTVELVRLLFNLTVALGIESVAESIGQPETTSVFPLHVRLVLANEDVDPCNYDVVVGFDYQYSNSTVAKRISPTPGNHKPMVLQLATTYSLEHIDLHIPQDLSENEKKNALLSGIVKARKLVRNSECHPAMEPHEVAEIFANYLNGVEETLSWEPQPMPDSVLDIFVNSQGRSQMPLNDGASSGNGLKRKLSDDNIDAEDEDAKRLRTLTFKEPTTKSNDPPLTYAVRELLKAGELNDASQMHSAAHISVPLASLEVLAEKFAELQRCSEANDLEAKNKANIISGLDSQVKEFQRTTHKVSEALRVSLLDRSTFETEKRKAEAAVKTATEAAQKEVEKAQKRVAELEASLALLASRPAGSQEDVAAQSAKLLKEAEDQVQVLERRLQNASKDNDYIRSLYQDVNGRAGSLAAENRELLEENKALDEKASRNLKEIHTIQRDNTIKIYLQTITDLKIQMREKEIELDRARDELRLMKNGRPQTRQASVPQSPRMGIMSPRPGRVAANSRGTSPVPGFEGNGGIAGMQFMGQQPGNGRWNHLRD